jgi:Cch helix turn helix domain
VADQVPWDCLSFTTHQGAGARVLTIARPPFPAGDTAGADAAALTAAVGEHYGTAGPAFVDRLRRELAAGQAPAIRGRHRYLAEAHRGETDLAGRRAPLLAALRIAGELAWAWDVVSVEPPAPALWGEVFHAEEQTDNRPEMALDVVREYVASNYHAFWRPGVHTTPPMTGWAGRIVTPPQAATVALLPQRLREVLTRTGVTLDAVLSGWQEAGALGAHRRRHGAPGARRAVAPARRSWRPPRPWLASGPSCSTPWSWPSRPAFCRPTRCSRSGGARRRPRSPSTPPASSTPSSLVPC